MSWLRRFSQTSTKPTEAKKDYSPCVRYAMGAMPAVKFDPSTVSKNVKADLRKNVNLLDDIEKKHAKQIYEAALRSISAGRDLQSLCTALMNTPDQLGRHGLELTDMAEGEGAKERPERGRCHHACPSTAPVEPVRSTSAWSIWEAPAEIAWTKVQTLRPGSAPPTRPENRSVAFTSDSRPSRATGSPRAPAPRSRRGSARRRSPGSGRDRAILDDTESASRVGGELRLRHRYSPSWGGLFGGSPASKRPTYSVAPGAGVLFQYSPVLGAGQSVPARLWRSASLP